MNEIKGSLDELNAAFQAAGQGGVRGAGRAAVRRSTAGGGCR